jgi:hypothetical protein
MRHPFYFTCFARGRRYETSKHGEDCAEMDLHAVIEAVQAAA